MLQDKSEAEDIGQKARKATIPNNGGLSLNELRDVCHAVNLAPGDCQHFIELCTRDFNDIELCGKLVWEKKQ